MNLLPGKDCEKKTYLKTKKDSVKQSKPCQINQKISGGRLMNKIPYHTPICRLTSKTLLPSTSNTLSSTANTNTLKMLTTPFGMVEKEFKNVPILEETDLTSPKLQSSLSILSALDSLKLRRNCGPLKTEAYHEKVLSVKNILSKNPAKLRIPYHDTIFHDLKSLKIQSEAIEKETQEYMQAASGAAPSVSNLPVSYDILLSYPFEGRSQCLTDNSSYNLLIEHYESSFTPERSTSNCCIRLCVTDI